MSITQARIANALRAAGWGGAEAAPLAGDASRRRYFRVRQGSKSAMLMDAPPTYCEDIQPFLDIGAHLRALGLSAPEIYYASRTDGLILMEDFGDGLYANLLADDRTHEALYYDAAVDVLVDIQTAETNLSLPEYGPPVLAQTGASAYSWYAKYSGAADQSAEFIAAFDKAYGALGDFQKSMTLRDFHAENLLWLRERDAGKRVGLLDFQDAALCHPVYDLVSLGTDGRRDVSPEIFARAIQRYADKTQTTPEALSYAIAVFSVQRNMRILGLFVRLAVRDGKPNYLGHIPRVWRYLTTSLQHPQLSEMRELILGNFQEPTPALIAKFASS